MSTSHPDSHSPDRLVRVQVLQTVDEVNARRPMTVEELQVFAAANGRYELESYELEKGKVRLMSPAESEHGFIAGNIAYKLAATVHRGSETYSSKTAA